MTENKTFKIIGDGVMLYFSKAFDSKTRGLKLKLWRWYNDWFQYTRCKYNKELDYFKVYYKDCRAKILNGTVLRHFTTGEGVDVHIHLNGSLISEPKEKMACKWWGINTSLSYNVEKNNFTVSRFKEVYMKNFQHIKSF